MVLIVGVCALLLLALQLLVSALRLQHIGYGGAWVWVLLVSALNAVILLQCITAPKGYHQHSKYDTGGLIGFGNRCSAQCLWQDCWRCEAMVDRESLVYQSRNWQNVGL